MANNFITYATNWWFYTNFDRELWESDLSNEDIMEDITLSVKFPWDFESYPQYRVTNVYNNMKFHSTDTEKTLSIPVVAVHKNVAKELDYLYVGYYYDNQYEISQYGGDGHRYLWYQQRYEDETLYSLPAIYVTSRSYYDEEYAIPVSEGSVPFIINTNLPVFEVTENFDLNDSHVASFQKTHNLEDMLSYSEVLGIVNDPDRETIREWYIYNEFKNGTASILEGFKPNTDALLIRRYEKIKTKGVGNLSLVLQADGSYNIVPDSGVTIIGSEYGTHTIYDLTAYTDTIHYYGPFYNYWDERTTGNVTCAIRVNSNMYWYANEQDRRDVENRVKKPDEVAIKKPDGDNDNINPTGPREKKTILSKPSWSNMCINQYILDLSKMTQLANKIFTTDDTEIEALVKGIGTMFSKPIDAIINISYYPFSLGDYTTKTNTRMYIGGWDSGINADKITSVTKRVVIGSFPFLRTHNDYRDFYTQSCQIYLPYIGLKQLDIKRFMGKTLRVEYAFDLYTNQCTALLLADDILVDYYNGTIGISIPLTATNYSEYASSVVSLTLAGAGIVGSAIATGGGSIGLGATLGIASTGFLPQVANTFNVNNYRESKGGLTSYISGFMPQYVYLLFEELEAIDNWNDINNLRGTPSNVVAPISSFSGFLSVSDVNLVCSNATASEKDKIRALLDSGIYIRE